MACEIPDSLDDMSKIMVVPDQQEAFVNDDGSISVIIEILEYQHVPDASAAECANRFAHCVKGSMAVVLFQRPHGSKFCVVVTNCGIIDFTEGRISNDWTAKAADDVTADLHDDLRAQFEGIVTIRQQR
ncbi:mog1 protein, putative [Eimeria mitis]|uniref:Mog1 protein, putative n=1 Tax=Eimeria mitis TaxID=44415 RepID=U6JXB9_9EIME|nr:mog1 protein, putative [Eimeria mitis]CDJ30130.1 mog1 protein, putative [Eimeria mitis]